MTKQGKSYQTVFIEYYIVVNIKKEMQFGSMDFNSISFFSAFLVVDWYRNFIV